MAIKQIREVPSKLPAARLFLDDVDEITSIISQLPGYPRFGDKKVDASTIKYKLDDRTCDTIEDLKKIGGKTRKFQIDFERGNLSITKYGSSFRSYASEEGAREEAWKAYSKIREVFEHRASGVLYKLRNNTALSILLFAVLWFSILVIGQSLTVRPIYSYGSDIIYWTALAVVFLVTSLRHSVVELRYFDEAKNERLNELRPIILTAIISAIASSLITLLVARIVKWLFP